MAEEIEELRGKERANLRNEQLRILIGGWEKKRDELLDEISFRKGQTALLEELIKQAYESILNVNKEEKNKEEDRIQARLEELKLQAEVEAEIKRNEESLELHAAKQKAISEGTIKAKPHPNDRGRDLQKRKAESRKKKQEE